MTRLPPRDAASGFLLVLLLALALAWADDEPGPGPLAACTAVAAAHAALLAPSLGAGAPWVALLGLPALAAAAYGHGGAALPLSLLLVALAAGAGLAGRRWSGAYLPSMVLVFAAPYALAYLQVEFGSVDAAQGWRRLSPIAAADAIVVDGALPASCALLLLFWPVFALARRARR